MQSVSKVEPDLRAGCERTRPKSTCPEVRFHQVLLLFIGAVVPKCVVCVLSYAGLAASLGLARPELCGAAPDNYVWLAIVGAVAGLVVATVYGTAPRHG